MPAKKNKITSTTEQDSKQKSDRQSNPGVYVSGGQIEQSDYDKLDFKTLMKDYTEMRNDDSIASSSIDILIYPILNSKFTIMPGYKEGEKPSDLAIEVAEYVQDVYNKLQSKLKYYIRHKLLALFYGFSIFEKIWKKGDTYNGKIVNRLVDLYPIQQDTIYWWKYDEQANFTGIKQEQRIPERGFKYIDIDAEYLHIYTPFEEFKNIQGRSMLRPSRLVWKIKRQIWMASGRASSRGAGIPEFQFTPTGNKENDTALKTTIETMARNVGNSENAYVMSQPGVVDFKLHQLQNQEMNIQLIQQANTEMFYNTLSEFVTSGIGGNGSRAATGEHKSPYFDALDAIISTFEDNEDILIKEIIYNSHYASISEEELPYCVIERPKTTDIIGVGTLINNMLSSRSISKTPDIEVYLRDMLGLPEKTEEELERVKEENISEQLQPTQENKDGMQSQDKSTEETEVKKDYNSEMSMLASDSEGTWITINGRHVQIDGEGNPIKGSISIGKSPSVASSDSYSKYVSKNYMDKINKDIDNKTGDFEAITDYNSYFMGGGYEDINNYLRGNESRRPEENKIASEKINKFIDNYKIKDDLNLYRGMSLDNKTIEKLSKNKGLFRPKTIMSMTGDKNIAYKFASESSTDKNKSMVLMEIRAKKGNKIAPLIGKTGDNIIANSSESEFVGNSNNKYKIKSVKKEKRNGKILYRMILEVNQ